ncbi:MAG: PTS sugar transporter subunit IIA [Gemmatimonadales bacterium]
MAIRGVVVGHAGLAAALVNAVEQIAGAGSGLVALSNSDCDRGALEERIVAAAVPGPTLVFIDMPSGSCHFAAMRRLESVPDVRVVTGVNLAMLLEFVFHREGDLGDVARHLADVGARAVGTH